MTQESRTIRVPAAVVSFLEQQRKALVAREVEHVRLVPLILREPLETLVKRRQRIFSSTEAEETPYGIEVRFSRQLKKPSSVIDGRVVRGSFHILKIDADIAVVSGSSDRDISIHGPKRFSDKSYPLARRPFFPSTTLTKLLHEFADTRGLEAISLDAKGYHRETGKFRRDCYRQPPAQAATEMAAQKRNAHSMLVSFNFPGKPESARFAFDRHASVNVKVGNPLIALQELVLPGLMESLSSSVTYQIERAIEPVDQEMVELEFRDAPFDNYDTMHSLCNAVRRGDGLNVSIIHLNPYLQAQVLDFFTGAVVDMLVTDSTNVSLIPRSPASGIAIERIASTIFEFFGEAKARRLNVIGST